MYDPSRIEVGWRSDRNANISPPAIWRDPKASKRVSRRHARVRARFVKSDANQRIGYIMLRAEPDSVIRKRCPETAAVHLRAAG